MNFKYKTCIICEKEYKTFVKPNKKGKRTISLRQFKSCTCSPKCAKLLIRIYWKFYSKIANHYRYKIKQLEEQLKKKQEDEDE